MYSYSSPLTLCLPQSYFPGHSLNHRRKLQGVALLADSISERSEGRIWLLRSRVTLGISRGDCGEQVGEIYAIEKVKRRKETQ